MSHKKALMAISPLDGRYHNKTEELSDYFSEYALIKYRVMVEVEYFKFLIRSEIDPLHEFTEHEARIDTIIQNFDIKEAQKIKEIEKQTNHDVKAVEYYLQEKFNKEIDLPEIASFIHFGLTSQDINNTAIPLLLKEYVEKSFQPLFEELMEKLISLRENHSEVVMISHTHGQPASPTKMGKEWAVFIQRLQAQNRITLEFPAKFSGATGNFNAHIVAYPDIDWVDFAHRFIEDELGLSYSFPTTQIDHYDKLAEIFDYFRRVNVILIDMCRDIWLYIMLRYFKQKAVKTETGSSTMPHKVNPIDFENAEGNFMIANANFDFLSNKLPVSRLQRDLTDSTVLRNIGVPIGHTVVAIKSLLKGLGKLEINHEAIAKDLKENSSVIAEGIQTVLRTYGMTDAYERLKGFSRGKQNLSLQDYSLFIDGLDVAEHVKKELRDITPENYTGIL